MIVEKPVTFGRSGSLVGVVCGPADAQRHGALPTAIFINAGIIHRVGPNRLYVNLARTLAQSGIRSLRFDLGGIGDSASGRDERGSSDEIVHRDITDAIDFATAESAAGVVLIGLCSGADNALMVAVAEPRVVGVVMLDPNIHLTRGFYVRHFWRALRSSKTWRLLLTGKHPATRRIARLLKLPLRAEREEAPWLAPSTLPARAAMGAQIQHLLDRGCNLYYVFTGGLPYRYNHARQFDRNFPDLRRNGQLAHEYHPRWDHTFSGPDAQRAIMDKVLTWFASTYTAPRARAG